MTPTINDGFKCLAVVLSVLPVIYFIFCFLLLLYIDPQLVHIIFMPRSGKNKSRSVLSQNSGMVKNG